MNALKKKYKDIMEPTVVEEVRPEDVLQFPGLSMNLLCGNDRGIRKGSVVHWWGPRGALKTTTMLEMIREAQAKWPEKICAIIDLECRIDLYNATKDLNVNTEPYSTGVPRLIYRRPETVEDAWEMVDAFASSGHFSFIGFDSATAGRSKNEVENPDFSLGQVGNAARINSAALKKYSPVISASGTILWGINQERIVMVQPIVQKGPTGGAAWGFYCTQEFHTTRITREAEDLNQELEIKSEKMKWGPSQRKIYVPILLGKGIKAEADIIRVASEAKVVDKNGSWYSYHDTRLGQGEDNAAEYLKQNPNLMEEIKEQVYDLALN